MTDYRAREFRGGGSAWKAVLAAVLAALVVVVMPMSAMAGTPKFSLGINKSEGGTQPLLSPSAVATDSVGNVYVIAGSPQSVQKFNSAGKYLAKFATGQFFGSGISVDSKGNIWVADTGNSRVAEFSSTGTLVKSIPTEWEPPQSVDVDSAGNIWAVTRTFVWKYAPTGEVVNLWSLPTVLPRLGGVAIDLDSAGLPWVTDTAMKPLIHIGGPGPEKLAMAPSEIAGVAYDPSGSIWVAAGGACRVLKYSTAGALLDSFGECGTGTGKFNSISKAAGLARGPEGALWVVDTGKNEVQKWVPTP